MCFVVIVSLMFVCVLIKGKIPWKRKLQPTLVFLLKNSHGQKSLVGYSPWGSRESDTTEQLTLLLQEVGPLPGPETGLLS